jgi:SAM-dependent methyltransferase
MEDLYTIAAEFYDLTPPYAGRSDIDFYRSCASDHGGPVLELGCGTGRILIPIASDGIEVVGLDNSSEMLGICRRKLASQPEAVRSRVQLVQADMARFAFDRRFALTIVPFRAFQHLLDTDEQLSCLELIRRHLRPDGRFVLDVFDPDYEKLVGPFPSEWVIDFDVTTGDGVRLVRQSRILDHEKERQIQHCQFVHQLYNADGSYETKEVTFAIRCIFRPEAEHLLARAGLQVEHVYGDYERRPYRENADLIFVCRRAEDA